MRISDWSSDVCSSDLVGTGRSSGQTSLTSDQSPVLPLATISAMRSLVAGPAAWGLVEDAGTAGWRLVGAVVAADGCFAVSGWGASGLQAASTIKLSAVARTEIFVMCKFVMCKVARTGDRKSTRLNSSH